MENSFKEKPIIGVIGLGYVGLPLLYSFSKHFEMLGFDISEQKIANLLAGIDDTHEIGDQKLKSCLAKFTNDPKELKNCDLLIVAVPTPVNQFNIPDLEPISLASQIIAKNLKQGAIIVYESTVYPGVTEEVCLPILESFGLIYKKDFYLGYSPERINPGDANNRFEDILKIVAGDSQELTDYLASIYGKVIKAGIYKAESIKVAEAAKVIENTQRACNIALMNELSLIFHRMGIDTRQVINAAATKWNFVKMHPGLVGGHCIGVDPYYLTYKAESLGIHPHITIGSCKINDSMPRFVAEETIKSLISVAINVNGAKILVAGLTFKENVPDTRNSKGFELIERLKEFYCDIDCLDPYISDAELEKRGLTKYQENTKYDALVLCVAHQKFLDLKELALKVLHQAKKACFIDIKASVTLGSLPENILHWRL